MSPVKTAKKDCPCESGVLYKECCGPLHAGKAAATSPEALMRSRFSAFARGEVGYLVRTLDPEHEDRAMGEAALTVALRETCSRLRFMGLTVLDAIERGDEGEVTFRAKVFDKGRDVSFTERSEFRRRAGAWVYVGPLPARS